MQSWSFVLCSKRRRRRAREEKEKEIKVRYLDQWTECVGRYQTLHPTILSTSVTPLGRTQCWNLRKTFPHHHKIDLILSSPHRRAIKSTIIVFGNTLNRSDVRYLLVPDAQEISSKPSGVGLPLHVLKNVEIPKLLKDSGLSFGVEKIGFELIKEDWNRKKNLNSPDIKAVKVRAAALRAWIYELEAQHVVLVMHQTFIRYLAEYRTVEDTKKSNYSQIGLMG